MTSLLLRRVSRAHTRESSNAPRVGHEDELALGEGLSYRPMRSAYAPRTCNTLTSVVLRTLKIWSAVVKLIGRCGRQTTSLPKRDPRTMSSDPGGM